MSINYRVILRQLNKLDLLHRIYIQRAAAQNRVCFGQIPLLEYTMEHEACTQKDIADFLQVSPPTVAAAVKRLEKSGMLQRVADQKDLRCNRLTVTETGKNYVRSCCRAFDDVDALAFRGFREEECQALYDYLQRLTANLEADEFRERSFHSLVDEEKRLHIAMKMEEKKEDNGCD